MPESDATVSIADIHRRAVSALTAETTSRCDGHQPSGYADRPVTAILAWT